MIKMIHTFRLFIALVSMGLVLSGASAFAQSAAGADEISLFVGEHLPAGINGISDIMPVFGGRYGIATNRIGIINIGAFNTHAAGVDFTTGELSLQGELALSPGLGGAYYAGIDMNYYRPAGDDTRQTELGYHAGVGAMLSLTDTLWLRGDLKFMGGPGTNLLMLFGIVFK